MIYLAFLDFNMNCSNSATNCQFEVPCHILTGDAVYRLGSWTPYLYTRIGTFHITGKRCVLMMAHCLRQTDSRPQVAGTIARFSFRILKLTPFSPRGRRITQELSQLSIYTPCSGYCKFSEDCSRVGPDIVSREMYILQTYSTPCHIQNHLRSLFFSTKRKTKFQCALCFTSFWYLALSPRTEK